VKKSMFSVFDVKSSIFANPFTSTNVATATRDFTRACNDPQSDLFAFPADYTLFHIADFDDYTGEITLIQKTAVCTAANCKE